jgi:hypothetical protein
MLTAKQIKALPKGTYKNIELHRMFPDQHGKKNRIAVVHSGYKDASGKPVMNTILRNRSQSKVKKVRG